MQGLKDEERYRRYSEMVKRNEHIIYKACSLFEQKNKAYYDDLCQDVLLHLWDKFDKFKDAENEAQLIWVMALHEASNRYRRFYRKHHHIELTESIPAPEELMEEESVAMSSRLALKELYDAMEQLDKKERAMLIARMEGESHKKMAMLLGINGAAMRKRYSRVLQKMRLILKGELEND